MPLTRKDLPSPQCLPSGYLRTGDRSGQRPSKPTSNNPKPRVELERASIYWIHEAITYLGLDRLGLNKPEQAIYRMVRKGILRPRKIGRYLAFTKGDLDYVITNGERKRTPGRPRKFEK